MFHKVLLVLSALLSLGHSSPMIGGINVGTVIKTESETFAIGQSIFPFMAHLKIFKKVLINGILHDTHESCGGTIISQDAVLTAAHCLINSDTKPEIHVEVGMVDYDLETLTTPGSWSNNFVIHDRYIQKYDALKRQLEYSSSDIAIIWLDTPLEFSQTVQPAQLPQADIRVGGRIGTVLGWGSDETKSLSSMLKAADMRILSSGDCWDSYRNLITSEMFCALSKYRSVALCTGDSGAPFVKDGIVYGILSFGFAEKDDKGDIVCDPKQPAVFTNLVKYQKWIEEKLQERERSKTEPPSRTNLCGSGQQSTPPAKRRKNYHQESQYNEVLKKLS